MDNQLSTIEQIRLPDPRRPEAIPSLPVWLERSSAAAKPELQLTQDASTFEEVLTLPASMMPSQAQRQAIGQHIDSLRSYLLQRPTDSEEAETKIAAAVTNLLLVLPSSRKSDMGSEARADVYLDVLDDLNWWAVKGACRRWLRHDCGKDERGQEHDYRWCPDPGTLRNIAMGEEARVRHRVDMLQKVLDSREFVDCTEAIERGRAAMEGLNIARKKGMDYGRMTFDDAIRLASESKAEPVPTQQAAE